jgi:hypothetical protein
MTVSLSSHEREQWHSPPDESALAERFNSATKIRGDGEWAVARGPNATIGCGGRDS